MKFFGALHIACQQKQTRYQNRYDTTLLRIMPNNKDKNNMKIIDHKENKIYVKTQIWEIMKRGGEFTIIYSEELQMIFLDQ